MSKHKIQIYTSDPRFRLGWWKSWRYELTLIVLDEDGMKALKPLAILMAPIERERKRA